MEIGKIFNDIHKEFYGDVSSSRNSLFTGGNVGNALLGYYLKEGLTRLAQSTENIKVEITIKIEDK